MNAPENSLQALLLQNKDAIIRFLRVRMRGEADEVEDRFHDTWIKLGRIEPRGPIRDRFRELTRLFDHKWYGAEDTTRGDYERCRELAAEIVADGVSA